MPKPDRDSISKESYEPLSLRHISAQESCNILLRNIWTFGKAPWRKRHLVWESWVGSVKVEKGVPAEGTALSKSECLVCMEHGTWFWKNLFMAALGLVAVRGLPLVVARGACSWLWCSGFLRWLFLWSTGSGHTGFNSCSPRAQSLWLAGSRVKAG